MTERIFRTNPAYRDELKKFLETDCGKAMVSIISQRAKAKSLPVPQPGVPFDTLMAHQLNRCYEANNVVEHILRLSEPPTERENVQEEEIEFFHSLDEKTKAGLRKMRLNQP